MKGQPFKRLLGVLKNVAPTAVAALGGPYGALAAGVMKKVMGNESMTDDDLESAVLAAAASPADVVKLKEIEAAMKAQEQALAIRFAELEVEDRQGARNLAIQTNYWPQVVLSVLFVVGYFVILGLFFSAKLIVPMNEAFMIMLGVLTAGVPQVMGFWLGSSSGSQRKTDALVGK